ncbi:thymidylate kinase [Pholiota conissans]|uniref:Thymidylate kinase n=1 Tax=Pholiota conissans TaxID=109636 RepID=A0A9P5Z9X1_9AGAR|nr:thymidylate kinase [Pholiota conissans]
MAHDTQKRRAPFIVIEGLDRSGKTTQTARLHEQLKANGVEASLIKFPDRSTPIGKMIDAYLRSVSELDDRAVHLLFSANRWELASKIESTLLAGTTIICDRYAFSGIAFSAAKVSPAEPSSPLLPFEWCRAPDIGLPAPDLVLFLDITPEQARARGGYGEERYEKEEMQARVRALFGQIGSEMQRGSEGAENMPRWVVVDAGREMEVVERNVWDLVYPLVEEGIAEPVGKLWTR